MSSQPAFRCPEAGTLCIPHTILDFIDAQKSPNEQITKPRVSTNIPDHQFSSVAQSCLTLCDPMNRSTPDLPVHHQLPEFTQTHVHRVCDAIQPSHPLSSPL